MKIGHWRSLVFIGAAGVLQEIKGGKSEEVSGNTKKGLKQNK
jgi:hypothetical protein